VPCDPVRCDEVAKALPRLLDTARRADRPMTRHVETCLRCQAEWAKYRGMLRLLEQLRGQHPPLPDGVLSSVLAALDQRTGQEVVGSALAGRRVLVGGAAVVAVGATAATVALAVGRGRSARSARAS
jgi:hypothetical protein